MDVGLLAADLSSFDITDFDETASVLSRTDNNGVVQNRWLYKDEQNRLVTLTRSEDISSVLPVGQLIKLSEAPGVGVPTFDGGEVARLLTQVDFDSNSFSTKQVALSSGEVTAFLVPVAFV